MVGDPLYRPYAAWLDLDPARDAGKEPSDWKMYHDFAIKNAALEPAKYRAEARQAASRAHNGPMIEDLGLMEAKDGNTASAISCFQQARATYTKRDDILRVVLEEAEGLVKQGNSKRAVELVRNVLKVVAGPTGELLKKVEEDISPGGPKNR